VVPLPAEAIVILPGRDLASAMNSLTFFAGTEGWITITSGTLETNDVVAKSLTGS